MMDHNSLTILGIDSRRVWAIKHLGPGVRMASVGEHATVTTPVRTVTPFIGPETAEDAGWMPDNPVDDWRYPVNNREDY